jgi:hypothetical protein
MFYLISGKTRLEKTKNKKQNKKKINSESILKIKGKILF